MLFYPMVYNAYRRYLVSSQNINLVQRSARSASPLFTPIPLQVSASLSCISTGSTNPVSDTFENFHLVLGVQQPLQSPIDDWSGFGKIYGCV